MYNHTKHSTLFKRFMIAIEIIYCIVAIVMGVVFKTENRYGDDVFNWRLAIVIWLSNAPLLAILYSIYAILDNQEKQIDVSYKIFEQLQITSSTANRENIEKRLVPSFNNPTNANNFWVCPKCGDKNNQSAIQCSCGYIKSKTAVPEKSFTHICSNCKNKFTVKYKPDANANQSTNWSVCCPHCKTYNTIKLK